MNRMQIGSKLTGFVCLLGLAGCVAEEAAIRPMSAGSSVSAATESETASEAASEALSDSLEGCLARIPNGSSAGARMVAEQSCRDNEEFRQSVVGAAIAKSGDRASAGTQGDSIEACMALIPPDATEGQRMLAEESCQRDQLTHR